MYTTRSVQTMYASTILHNYANYEPLWGVALKSTSCGAWQSEVTTTIVQTTQIVKHTIQNTKTAITMITRRVYSWRTCTLTWLTQNLLRSTSMTRCVCTSWGFKLKTSVHASNLWILSTTPEIVVTRRGRALGCPNVCRDYEGGDDPGVQRKWTASRKRMKIGQPFISFLTLE